MTNPIYRGAAARLTSADLDDAARCLDVDRPTIDAVIAVESAGTGFLQDATGRPRILFEAHHFGRLTQHRHSATHPSLSTRAWDNKLYLGGAAEYGRLDRAMALDETAALEAASWGLFQIMGFNHGVAGYATVQAFVAAMAASETAHLQAFLRFVGETGLSPSLRAHDWTAFARGYNGPGYARNRYPEKLAAAWLRAGGAPDRAPGAPRLMVGSTGDEVRRLQAALRPDEAHLKIDGVFGRATEAAVMRFQRRHGLDQDGIVGPRTFMALVERGASATPHNPATTPVESLT